ncbi:L,D-transpeptidase family protein [Streptomyces sp. HGB0020]|uniref:L,D-transpeptidase family protein n=1 Tax=Streptomyces sp. HGB0020 TaxID=1078086 RepID=UPI00039D001F|nr:L,D-transpeptidase family protein [Streptomyces sp. HGB0020]
MRKNGASRTAVAAVALGTLLASLSACGGTHQSDGGDKDASAKVSAAHGPAVDRTRIPGIGDRLHRRIPADSGQVLAVYGDGRESARSTAVLYTKHGGIWSRERGWPAHNGRKGWTTDHHEDDLRSPVGVFTLSDAGGVLADPGSRLPYTHDASFAAPHWWAKSHWHDFDYVIAIDYNRLKGTPPDDPTRPQGDEKGGGIWLHLDHGSGTSACISLSKAAMQYLLRTLDPHLHPVVVMGDRANLKTQAAPTGEPSQ